MRINYLKLYFTSILVLLSCTLIQAQELTVTGTIVDQTGMPLPGVTIKIKDKAKGTVSDFDGLYTIAAENQDVLVFSFLGFANQEVTLDGQTSVNITLKENAAELGEVVVVGFGKKKKVNLTGAVASVDSETFKSRPVQNATQMLQGVVGGLNINQSSGGSLESRPSINIRGTTTIGSGSTGSPLVLIDGMQGDINAINPQDIESVSVLKDAAAASIYGSRAAFGVILVTTKTGKKGIPSVQYSTNFRLSTPLNMPEMMDSYTFATFFNDANINGNNGPIFSEERLQRIKDYQSGVISDPIVPNPSNPSRWADGYAFGNANVNWYDAIYRKQSYSQEHNFSVRGGGDRVRYYVSGNYLDQNGLMEFNRDKFKRYTTTAKVGSDLTDWLTLNVSMRFIREDYGRPSALNDNLFQDLARQGWPVLPLYDANGYLYSSPSPALGLRDGGRDVSQKDWLYQQAQFVIKPTEGLEVFAEFNYRIRNDFRHWDVLQTFNHDVNGDPYLYNRNSSVYEYAFRENYFNTNIYSTYNFDIEEKHNFSVTAGFQSELNKYRSLSADRTGVILPALPVLDLTSGVDANGNVVAPSIRGEYQNWATAGYFARLNYNFKERYLLEANIRYDGTSRFQRDKRWQWFPSVSAGWNVAKEEFWGDLYETISTFKFRGSWGELGNQNTDDWYPTYLTMPIGTANGGWLVNGQRPNTSSAPGLVSQSLTWEKVQSWNVGLDLALFKNRLTGSFDYFTRYTLDMVGPAPELPVVLGTAVPQTNNTDLKTYGFELSLSWKDRLSNGLGYGIDVLLSDSQAEITRYPNQTNSLNTYRTGQKVGEIWGYETLGIAKTEEEMQAHLNSLPNGGQDALGNQWAAGDIMYKDLNGDGKIDSGSWTSDEPGDRKVIGNSTVRYPFAITLNADWKGFDFRAFFQGVLKQDYFQGSYYFWGVSDSQWWSTGFVQHEDYFRADENHPLGQNTDAYYPRPLFNTKNKQTQSKYLQDASYIRLKNVQLGYTIPSQVYEDLGIKSFRIYVAGENLWTATAMSKVFDPETIDGGSGGNVYPLSTTFAFGLNINF
ncbi:TonB-linked SusC/RagA family outer membrane protein [Leeuwenhoekiella aestuarii]|uniref:TonB-linked SusC/RagA family outer membrane protein n=1 Tax=Leeuwenhoekiella aestuarii TaxID=2249426 RepID=A0A4Q0NVL3_9FLAO|nr:TonB-dependent receptor [Leeuwenhoekiella aestuarii]RXG15735.1 TonB-linked SusC/RagA family outer membrane protein [Leeuwenhoekiella aestuarii]RXG17156.1 TonB-linked SusC/RagA family outer membrane protein [Leeuwenhoekiella aestuarii]